MCLCMCCSQVGINWNKCACALFNNCPGFPYFRREGMTKGKKRKGATRTDSQEASGKYVPQFNKKLKINSEPEDSEQFEDIAITDGKAEVQGKCRVRETTMIFMCVITGFCWCDERRRTEIHRKRYK